MTDFHDDRINITTPACQLIAYFFLQQRKSFVSTRSYRFVNIRLARMEYDKLQKSQGMVYNI